MSLPNVLKDLSPSPTATIVSLIKWQDHILGLIRGQTNNVTRLSQYLLLAKVPNWKGLDTPIKSFATKDFVLMIKIMIDQSFNKRMPTIFLIKNLYVPLGIPFNPKWYYKDGNKIGVRLT